MASVFEEFQKSWLTSILGITLFSVGIWLLTWNEGRAVHHAHSLDEAHNNAIALNPYEPLKPELDGRVVHISGNLMVDEPLTEPEYGISIQAIKLKRRVQMYQWVEERTPRDYGDSENTDSSDYYYVTEWRDKLVDSTFFYIRNGHQNPTEIPLKTKTWIAPHAKLGHLVIGNEIKEKFNDFVEVTSDERPERRDVKLHVGIYYHCDDVWNPVVGDIRVQFYYAGLSGEPVTIVAQQKNNMLIPFTTSKGHNISLLRYGIFNLSQMFNAEHSDVRMETWKYRGAGLFILYFASICLSRMMKIMFFNIPILKNVLTGDSPASGNFVLSMSISLLVISTAWIFYRPVLGAGLVFAAISPMLYCTLSVFNAAQIGYQSR